MIDPQQKSNGSVAESVAFALAKTDWTRKQMVRAVAELFTPKRSWVEPFVARIFLAHPDRPPVATLVKATIRDTDFRQALKTYNLRIRNSRVRLDRSCFRSPDWDLPAFISVGDLASHLGLSVSRLFWLAAIRGNPDRRSPHYVCKWIRKRSTGFRLIESPKLQLKTIQRQLLDDIFARIPVHDSAHGFCRGRNVVSFVKPHVGSPIVLRMDLKDFFPRIGTARVKGLLRAAGYSLDVSYILAALCTTATRTTVVEAIRPPAVRGQIEASRLYLPRHLPQGAPTSPAVANLIAYRFDCRLSGLARSAGATFTRYADDLLFSGDKSFARSVKRFANSVAVIALEEGFDVNFRKTRIQRGSVRQSAAGVVINEHPNLSRANYDRLKAILHNCVRSGPASQNRDDLPNFRAHLAGRVNWVLQLNPARGAKLNRLLDQIDWTSNRIPSTVRRPEQPGE